MGRKDKRGDKMKKIIKTGKFVYKTTCNVCDCEFVYDEQEVENEEFIIPDGGSRGVYQYVICPCCGEKIRNTSLNQMPKAVKNK